MLSSTLCKTITATLIGLVCLSLRAKVKTSLDITDYFYLGRNINRSNKRNSTSNLLSRLSLQSIVKKITTISSLKKSLVYPSMVTMTMGALLAPRGAWVMRRVQWLSPLSAHWLVSQQSLWAVSHHYSLDWWSPYPGWGEFGWTYCSLHLYSPEFSRLSLSDKLDIVRFEVYNYSRIPCKMSNHIIHWQLPKHWLST